MWAVLGVLSLALGGGLLGGLFSDGWALDDTGGYFLLTAVIAGLAGPLVALAGLYDLGRAQREQRSTTRARVLLVA